MLNQNLMNSLVKLSEYYSKISVENSYEILLKYPIGSYIFFSSKEDDVLENKKDMFKQQQNYPVFNHYFLKKQEDLVEAQKEAFKRRRNHPVYKRQEECKLKRKLYISVKVKDDTFKSFEINPEKIKPTRLTKFCKVVTEFVLNEIRKEFKLNSIFILQPARLPILFDIQKRPEFFTSKKDGLSRLKLRSIGDYFLYSRMTQGGIGKLMMLTKCQLVFDDREIVMSTQDDVNTYNGFDNLDAAIEAIRIQLILKKNLPMVMSIDFYKYPGYWAGALDDAKEVICSNQGQIGQYLFCRNLKEQFNPEYCLFYLIVRVDKLLRQGVQSTDLIIEDKKVWQFSLSIQRIKVTLNTQGQYLYDDKFVNLKDVFKAQQEKLMNLELLGKNTNLSPFSISTEVDYENCDTDTGSLICSDDSDKENNFSLKEPVDKQLVLLSDERKVQSNIHRCQSFANIELYMSTKEKLINSEFLEKNTNLSPFSILTEADYENCDTDTGSLISSDDSDKKNNNFSLIEPVDKQPVLLSEEKKDQPNIHRCQSFANIGFYMHTKSTRQKPLTGKDEQNVILVTEHNNEPVILPSKKQRTW